jgi:Chalcone isomerase-like
MKAAYLGLVGLLAINTGATAATLEGVTFPENQQVDGTSLSLNGVGLRSKLMIKVYVAGLYVANKSSDANAIINNDAPKRMVLQFLRSVSKDQMVDAYTEAFDTNAAAAKASLSKEIASLMAAFEPVSAGDQMVFTYVPGQGTTFAVKGKDKVTIAGLPFAKAMFACWIGPKPPSADFKKGVLGK